MWLGVELNTSDGLFKIPENRVYSIFKTLCNIISSLPYTSARKLAKLCGKLISTKFVLGNIVQLKTRRLSHAINCQISWDSRCSLNYHPKAMEEPFFFGKLNLKKKILEL